MRRGRRWRQRACVLQPVGFITDAPLIWLDVQCQIQEKMCFLCSTIDHQTALYGAEQNQLVCISYNGTLHLYQ
uniref:Uncharacterized protein n=1 Tax=Triticum urartu TaxID=4572 RepID=A0A8R7V756_TRIUA